MDGEGLLVVGKIPRMGNLFHLCVFDILWMDEILHHLSNHETPLFVGTYQGNQQNPGLLRWCEMDFATIHSTDAAWGNFAL